VFRELVERHPGCAALISTDGDGDRPLLVDETGEALGGDALGALVALDLGARHAAVPISTSDVVDRFLAPEGVALERTRIGSPYVIEAMNRALARGATGVVGWEANGGFLTGSELRVRGRVLSPLPTRDALLPLLAALVAARERGASLSELAAGLPRRFARSGLLDAFPREAARALLRRFSPPASLGLRAVEILGGEIRAASGDEPAAPVADPGLADRLRSLAGELEGFFPSTEGFGPLERIDLLDGLRLSFGGGDIAHLRPSGNAPQLRLYTVSDTPERADAILAMGLAEPDGILRRLERAADRAGGASSGEGA
jgi:phosphomannomutase